MKTFVNIQSRLMARRDRAVSMLEYVLIAAVILGLAALLRNQIGDAIGGLIDRISGDVNDNTNVRL